MLVVASVSVHAQSLHSEFMQAVDERRNDPELLARAVENWDNRALRLWGLMGNEACAAIRPYLNATEDVVSAALEGLANCRDTESYSVIAELARNGESYGVRSFALESLGFISTEVNRDDHVALVAGVLNSEKSDNEKAAALYGLMQAITYSGLSPSDLPGLDLSLLVEATRVPGKSGDEGAYLLSRLRELPSALSVGDLATSGNDGWGWRESSQAKAISQFGNEASIPLMFYSSGQDSWHRGFQNVAIAGMRSMGELTDKRSRRILLKTLSDGEEVRYRQVALAALTSREDYDEEIGAAVWGLVEDENPWLAVTALEGLVRLGDGRARDVAASWLTEGSFYKAFRAIAMLAGSDEGRAMLQDYLDKARDPVRARLVQGTLDPDATPPAPVRPTVPYVEAASSDGSLVTLKTTRGDITIEMFEGAPYSGHAFTTLANEGAMDGMIWHRVIPGFVAQFGQIDDMRQFSHGTIREEWGALSHMPGTVGVATSGPDTGSSQFFINLEHNRHLDGRYTVFGRVVAGMDVVYAMQEGDEIISAE